jgi:hypothetical protein
VLLFISILLLTPLRLFPCFRGNKAETPAQGGRFHFVFDPSLLLTPICCGRLFVTDPNFINTVPRLDDFLHDPNKGNKVETRHKEAEAELAAAKQRWEAISSSIHSEVCLAPLFSKSKSPCLDRSSFFILPRQRWLCLYVRPLLWK